MSEPGHLVPPLWLEANGIKPEEWPEIRAMFGAREVTVTTRRDVVRTYLRTVQEFSRAQIWRIILLVFAVGGAIGLAIGATLG